MEGVLHLPGVIISSRAWISTHIRGSNPSGVDFNIKKGVSRGSDRDTFNTMVISNTLLLYKLWLHNIHYLNYIKGSMLPSESKTRIHKMLDVYFPYLTELFNL